MLQKQTVLFMSLWNEVITLKGLGGTANLLKQLLKSPFLLTRSNAFVRSMNAM